MSEHQIHVDFPGRIVLIGFGSIGQGVLPLILRHIGGVKPERITIVTADDEGRQEAEQFGIKFVNQPLTRDNFKRVLDPLVGRGDFLLNLSVDVSSIALVKFCAEKGALYLDTCIEPWPGGYTDPTIPVSRRTNYALREEALVLRKGNPRAPTAVITHGANPGLVSHFVKQALINIAADTGVNVATPSSREEWGKLAQTLGIKVIHIAERDTQISSQPKQPGEFVNTWSVDGFVSEGSQPAELGWGTHERNFPRDGAAPRLRLPVGDLSECARRRYARAHLDAARGPFPRLPDHARRIDLDCRLFHGARRHKRRVSPHARITPITRATTRCSRCTNSPAATGGCRITNAS